MACSRVTFTLLYFTLNEIIHFSKQGKPLKEFNNNPLRHNKPNTQQKHRAVPNN